MADYAIHLGVFLALYGVLALGQGLLLGFGNLLFVTQAAAFGIGAYCWALLVGQAVPSELALPAAGCAAAIIIVPLAVPTIRLKGDYLLVASLALCEVVRSVLNNTPELTGGAQGIMGLPLLQFGAWKVASPREYLIVAGSLMCVVALGYLLIARSPYGRLLRATGEGTESPVGEDAMRAMHKPVRRVRVAAVATAAVTAGIAGGIYAAYMSYLDPTQFTIWRSVFILEMIVLGGLGTIRGALAGALVFVVLPELLRFVNLPSTVADPLRQVMFALLLLIMLRYRPAGLFGRKDLAWLRA